MMDKPLPVTGHEAPRRPGELSPASHWLTQLLPQGQDVISIAGFLMIIISLIWIIISRVDQLPAWRFYAAVLCTGAILLIHVFRRRFTASFSHSLRADLLLFAVMSLLALAVTWLSAIVVGSAYLILMIAGSAFFLLPLRPALLLTALTTLLFLWLFTLQPGVTQANLGQMVLALSFGLVFSTSVGWLVRRNTAQTQESRALAAALQAANHELLIRSQQEQELAAAEERIRLAREIHDGLGHHLTVLNVQLQVAGKLLQRQPEQLAEILENCREEAQAALAEVRRSVAVMRQTPLNGKSLPQALELLLGDFNRHSPLEASFQWQGEAEPLSPAASITCYRAAQEALTNVQKHARHVRQVQVRLAYEPDGLRLTVRDDGNPAPEANDGCGFGLAGLRERAEQLHGKLHAGRMASGYELSLWLPLEKPGD